MTIEVCLTPALIHQHDLSGKVAVVVDIFRATSCMVAGISFGVSAIFPVSEVEKCLEYGKKGMITAGERGGEKIPEFDIGNSPFDYMNPAFKGQEICVTTTNGTVAIEKAGKAKKVLIGSFLNITSTVDYLKSLNRDLLILCAGWKGTPNLEDTLFAGAMIDKISDGELVGDSALLSKSLFDLNSGDLLGIARQSSHARRLSGFGIEPDIEFCMKSDLYTDVVGLSGSKIIRI